MNACSQNCSHTRYKIDGFCVCLPGRTGAPTCNKECPLGFYGANCASTCSKHCDFNDTCDRQNGSCPRGCQDHYHGETCKQNHTEYVAANQNQDVDSDYQTVGLYASVGLNFVLIGVTFLLIRSSVQTRLSKSSEKTCDKEAYLSTLGNVNEYQELDMIDSSLPYQEVEFSPSSQYLPD
ncbi:protein draper-like [Saccostrea cucullata]|uniref:protein draper-like n=1 Tax=Saccostrea cuccullata TaxID=36930 RepID=UPI002ED65977